MQYVIGQKLIWQRNNNHDKPEEVTVTELRKRGQAKLSNGWVVDQDGYAEGTARVPGGFVTALEHQHENH
ncbi:MAG: hypothetical protein RL758_124 [Pseudomonadota bacterium]|jgi:hypothetical protein